MHLLRYTAREIVPTSQERQSSDVALVWAKASGSINPDVLVTALERFSLG